jgi:hypothetical protein
MRDNEYDPFSEGERRVVTGAGWAAVAITLLIISGLGYWKYASSGCDGIQGLVTVCSGKDGVIISK